VIEKHLTDDIHETLHQRWTGAGKQKQSIRDLTQYFNKAILEQYLIEADVEVLDGEVDNFYRLLSGDGSRGMETQAHRKLERMGINVETLMDDFVSHQTIYRHLTSCLDAEKEDALTNQERIERERKRIGRLQNKSEAVSEETLARLRRSDAITLGSFDVIVNFRVTCEECGVHRKITDVIQQGGCDCQQELKVD
jgi:hypothetical protein